MQLLANLKVKRPRGIEFIEHVIQDNFVAGACLLLMAKLFELLHANGGMQIGTMTTRQVRAAWNRASATYGRRPAYR